MQRAKKSTPESKEPETVKVTLKNFKHLVDVQDFYRFIYENKLRREAKLMFSELIARTKAANKRKKRKKKKATVQ